MLLSWNYEDANVKWAVFIFNASNYVDDVVNFETFRIRQNTIEHLHWPAAAGFFEHSHLQERSIVYFIFTIEQHGISCFLIKIVGRLELLFKNSRTQLFIIWHQTHSVNSYVWLEWSRKIFQSSYRFDDVWVCGSPPDKYFRCSANKKGYKFYPHSVGIRINVICAYNVVIIDNSKVLFML